MTNHKLGEVLGHLMYLVGTGRATVQHIEALAPLIPCWQRVDESLPEELRDVLVVWADDGYARTVDIAYRKPSGEWVLMGSEPEQVITPTHWMPLPALPGDDEPDGDEVLLGEEAGYVR